MYELTTAIRRYKWASWLFSLCMGIACWYLYGRIKNGIWLDRKLYFINRMIEHLSEGQTIAFFAAFNTLVELSSSIIPAMICAIVLIHFFQKKAILFCTAAILSFLLLSSRVWRYWLDPLAPMYIKIMGSITPIFDILVLVFTIWLIQKKKGHITIGSAADRG